MGRDYTVFEISRSGGRFRRTMMNRTIPKILAFLLAALSAPLQANAYHPEKALLFGIVPQQAATRLAKDWIPLVEAVAAATGLAIQFATAKDIPTFEKCLAGGTYDLAYMNPYHYVEFHAKPGYEAFAHARGRKLTGILVARKDSPIERLEDLDGKDIAFPSPAALGASVLPRAELAHRQILFTPHYVKSHDSVYRAVALGLYPAGGGVIRTFETIADDVRAQLRVFYETKGYTPHAFAAHPRVAPADVQRIAAAMAAIPAQSGIFQPLGMHGIDRAHDSEWDDIRDLQLNRRQTDIGGGTTSCHSD